MKRLILAVLTVAATAVVGSAQDALPGNPPYLWSADIGTWGTKARGGRVELFASPVDDDRNVGAFGVIWHQWDPKAEAYRIAHVRYPAMLCGAAYFSGLAFENAVQAGSDRIDVRLGFKHLDDTATAIGGDGSVAARVVNPARAIDGTVCPG